MDVTKRKTKYTFLVSDPCYFPEYHGTNGHARWMELLHTTDYFHNPPDGWVILDEMGGDGTYNVYITLRRN